MDECNSSEIDKTNLTDQTKIRLDKITEIENYFHQEINQRKLCSKKLSKYVAAFDYIGKILIVLGATSGGVYYFVYECCWSSCWKSKCKFCSNVISNNWHNQKITKHN